MSKYPILDSILQESIQYEESFPFSDPKDAFEDGAHRILSFLSEYDDRTIVEFIRSARVEMESRLNTEVISEEDSEPDI